MRPKLVAELITDRTSLTSPKAFVELGVIALSHRYCLISFLVQVKALE